MPPKTSFNADAVSTETIVGVNSHVAPESMSPSSRKVPKMTIEFFEESNAGTRTLPRSLAAKAGGFVFVSGQVARDENGDIIAGAIEAHTRQTMKNVAHALAFAGCTL